MQIFKLLSNSITLINSNLYENVPYPDSTIRIKDRVLGFASFDFADFWRISPFSDTATISNDLDFYESTVINKYNGDSYRMCSDNISKLFAISESTDLDGFTHFKLGAYNFIDDGLTFIAAVDVETTPPDGFVGDWNPDVKGFLYIAGKIHLIFKENTIHQPFVVEYQLIGSVLTLINQYDLPFPVIADFDAYDGTAVGLSSLSNGSNSRISVYNDSNRLRNKAILRTNYSHTSGDDTIVSNDFTVYKYESGSLIVALSVGENSLISEINDLGNTHFGTVISTQLSFIIFDDVSDEVIILLSCTNDEEAIFDFCILKGTITGSSLTNITFAQLHLISPYTSAGIVSYASNSLIGLIFSLDYGNVTGTILNAVMPEDLSRYLVTDKSHSATVRFDLGEDFFYPTVAWISPAADIEAPTPSEVTLTESAKILALMSDEAYRLNSYPSILSIGYDDTHNKIMTDEIDGYGSYVYPSSVQDGGNTNAPAMFNDIAPITIGNYVFLKNTETIYTQTLDGFACSVLVFNKADMSYHSTVSLPITMPDIHVFHRDYIFDLLTCGAGRFSLMTDGTYLIAMVTAFPDPSAVNTNWLTTLFAFTFDNTNLVLQGTPLQIRTTPRVLAPAISPEYVYEAMMLNDTVIVCERHSTDDINYSSIFKSYTFDGSTFSLVHTSSTHTSKSYRFTPAINPVTGVFICENTPFILADFDTYLRPFYAMPGSFYPDGLVGFVYDVDDGFSGGFSEDTPTNLFSLPVDVTLTTALQIDPVSGYIYSTCSDYKLLRFNVSSNGMTVQNIGTYTIPQRITPLAMTVRNNKLAMLHSGWDRYHQWVFVYSFGSDITRLHEIRILDSVGSGGTPIALAWINAAEIIPTPTPTPTPTVSSHSPTPTPTVTRTRTPTRTPTRTITPSAHTPTPSPSMVTPTPTPTHTVTPSVTPSVGSETFGLDQEDGGGLLQEDGGKLLWE